MILVAPREQGSPPQMPETRRSLAGVITSPIRSRESSLLPSQQCADIRPARHHLGAVTIDQNAGLMAGRPRRGTAVSP